MNKDVLAEGKVDSCLPKTRSNNPAGKSMDRLAAPTALIGRPRPLPADRAEIPTSRG